MKDKPFSYLILYPSYFPQPLITLIWLFHLRRIIKHKFAELGGGALVGDAF